MTDEPAQIAADPTDDGDQDAAPIEAEPELAERDLAERDLAERDLAERDLAERDLAEVTLPPLPETGDDRVDEALAELAAIAGQPPSEHVAVYEDVHRRLQDTLADLDGS